MAKFARIKNDSIIPIIILISDGKGNVPLWENHRKDISRCTAEIKTRNIPTIAIDTDKDNFSAGYMRQFAYETNARYFHINELQAKMLENVVKGEISTIIDKQY